METWPISSQEASHRLRGSRALFRPEDIPEISGSDISQEALTFAAGTCGRLA